VTPPKPEETGNRNGNDGITALPHGTLTTSIINLPNVFDKARIEMQISSGPAYIN
jgi:hypothetical protein